MIKSWTIETITNWGRTLYDKQISKLFLIDTVFMRKIYLLSKTYISYIPKTGGKLWKLIGFKSFSFILW